MRTIISTTIRLIIWLMVEVYLLYYRTDKIISSVLASGDKLHIGTGDMYANVVAYHFIKPERPYLLVLEDGTRLKASGGHMVICYSEKKGLYQKMVRHLTAGEMVGVESGAVAVKKVKRCLIPEPMFDASVADPHTYLTNGIMSHNTIVTAIYLVWYVLNHVERNVMIISQNGDKVKELMDKIKVVVKNLPWFLKPGIITNNVMTMVFDNGCKIVAQTTSANSGASFTIHVLYIDEFALISPTFLVEFYRTVYPVVSSSEISKIIITSTPRGMNKFYEIYTNALNGINSYNPIRVDWWDVPGRDEKWKQETINDLGSEEDFNQEFGNQFTAGSDLVFKSNQLKVMKYLRTVFVNKPMEELIPGWYQAANDDDIVIESHKLSDGVMDTPNMMKWYPKFDTSKLSQNRYQFVITIDIADGDGGDYFVANFFQILPMSLQEVERLPVYGEVTDFFKLVQVGIYRTNMVDIPQNAAFLYYMLSEAFATEFENENWNSNKYSGHYIVDNDIDYDDEFDDDVEKDVALNVYLNIEINKEGKYFINLLDTINGDSNLLDMETLVVKTLHRSDSVNPKMGLLMNSPNVKYAVKLLRRRMKYNQIVISESTTVDESMGMATDDKGKLVHQTKHDDCFDSVRNLALFTETDYYKAQVEQMIPFLPREFLDAVYNKLNMGGYVDEAVGDDISDLMDAL